MTIRDLLVANRVRAPARAGALAPLDVVVPAQNTGLGPEKTSFFQVRLYNTSAGTKRSASCQLSACKSSGLKHPDEDH